MMCHDRHESLHPQLQHQSRTVQLRKVIVPVANFALERFVFLESIRVLKLVLFGLSVIRALKALVPLWPQCLNALVP